MPDIPSRRRSIPLVTDFATLLATKRASGIVQTRQQTVNDEELVSNPLQNYFILIFSSID
jgi:hypothetical protein